MMMRSSPSLHPSFPTAVQAGALLSGSRGQGGCLQQRLNRLCDPAVPKQARLLQALPAVTNSEGKGRKKKAA